jgi:tRNA uridine 5-carboxymethylaminomethyl modification enzyme
VRPGTADAAQIEQTTGEPLRREASALELLARPNLTYADLIASDGIGPSIDGKDPAVAEQLEIQTKYAGYVDRQRDEIERQRGHEAQPLPVDLDYDEVRGLSAEVTEKFKRVRPATIGHAARIPGVTPAAVSVLLIHLKRLSA